MVKALHIAAMREGRMWLFVVAGFILIAAWNNGLNESRVVRDFLGRTPFYDVEVQHVEKVENGLVLSGVLTKRRGQFLGLSAYVKINGVNYRTMIDTSPEEEMRPPGNRPAVEGAQAWGPWVIKWNDAATRPDGWSIWVSHKLPEFDAPRVNRFASGKWPEDEK